MIEIFVDADACPVKDEVYVVATRYAVRVTLVADAPIHVPAGLGAQLVVVDRGPDAADDWIAEHLRPGDIVITGDLPLAARGLEAGAFALGFGGRQFDAESIGGLLASRELNSHLRESGLPSGGPGAFAPRDRSRFLSKLDELVQRAVREEGHT